MSIINMSKTRVVSRILTDEYRKSIVMNVLNRVSNAKIGNTINNYRSNNLTRVNDVKFRTNLAVLSVKKESYKTADNREQH